MASFVSLSALFSEIFKEIRWGAALPPTGRGLSVSRFQEKIVKFSISASKQHFLAGKEQILPGSDT